MKNFIIITLISATIISCSNDKYEELNIDGSSPSEVPASFLVTNATTSLFDQMTSTNVNTNVFRLFAQYWTEVQYVDEANYDLRRRDIPGNHWGELYRDVLMDLKSAKAAIQSSNDLEGVKNNQMAIADILEVYAWQVLVDTFGNVPYTEALDGLNNPTPAYEDAETIYLDLISRISADIDALDASYEGFGADDIIYHGDVDAWKKLAASLKLRLGVQILDANFAVGSTAVMDAVSAGVFTSNADNFVIDYLSTDPYRNPVAVDLNSRNDFVSANTTVDIMNDLDDPRRAFYFRQNLGAGVYMGGVYGAGSSFPATTQVGDLMYESETPGDLLDYAEVEFLMAEALAKNVSIPGTVMDHYNSGIAASLEYWGVDATDAIAYMANPDVLFATASGTDLEKIAVQFWLAMYNRGFEGWNVWRRLDYPMLASPAPISGLPIPLRYTYPIDEHTVNTTNWENASVEIGGDEQQTPVFWDVN